MKKLHGMMIRAFAGPLFITFLIVLFILVMQFLWKYVDDLMGKGLEWYVLIELMTYATASFVPLALPLAVLLSSIMTMGGLGENSELVPMRSAGLGLMRIMLPVDLLRDRIGRRFLLLQQQHPPHRQPQIPFALMGCDPEETGAEP